MIRGTERTALSLLMLIIIYFAAGSNIGKVLSESAGGKIDLFTQKKPYDGKGSNKPSDAFGPSENVTIYALVTYNDYPVALASVSFEVHGPSNPVQNKTIFRSTQTNASGMTAISFRIGLIPEIYFGEWNATGTVGVVDTALQDSVSFKAGWLVEITSIRTVDEEFNEQNKFSRGTCVGVELSLQNIGLTERSATLSITIHDSLGYPVNSSEANDFTVPPNNTIINFHDFILIPEKASLGEASVFACALTAPPALGGVPYSPEASLNFLIPYRDVAVIEVEPSSRTVYEGETVEIFVTVRNKGEEPESLDIVFYANETSIGTYHVFDLQPKSDVRAGLPWNTSDVEEGFYQLSAFAGPVPEEADVSDNFRIDGFVEVKAKTAPPPPPPPTHPIHDIAAKAIKPSRLIVHIGLTVIVEVVVENRGTETESFNVVVYYNDSNVLDSFFVHNLEAGAEYTHNVYWDTSGFSKGNYTLSVLAGPVTGEENTDNNRFRHGIIVLVDAPKRWQVPDWLFWLLLILIVLIFALLIVWINRRKKRKKAEEAFHSGWTAWYQQYDLRNRHRE